MLLRTHFWRFWGGYEKSARNCFYQEFSLELFLFWHIFRIICNSSWGLKVRDKKKTNVSGINFLKKLVEVDELVLNMWISVCLKSNVDFLKIVPSKLVLRGIKMIYFVKNFQEKKFERWCWDFKVIYGKMYDFMPIKRHLKYYWVLNLFNSIKLDGSHLI